VLTVVLALGLIDQNDNLGVGDWVRTLLMADTFVAPHFPAGLTHMWSLAAEVSFYLLLPLLMLVAAGGRRLRPWRVASVLVVLIVVTVWWHLDGAARLGSSAPGSPLLWLPAYLSWFALGIGLALVQLLHEAGRWNRLTRPLVDVARQPGSCWAVVAGLLLVAATPLAGPSMLGAPTPAESLTKSLIYAAIGALVVLTGVFPRPGGAYARILGHPAPRRLGWISYGVFCLHLPILHLVMWTTGWELFRGHLLPMWMMTLTLCLVAAELTYRLVERPALRLKGLRPLAHRRQGSSSTRSSTATSGTSTR
jgi:peptidoglycan/LPS O-acetylase OafA/YrhL